MITEIPILGAVKKDAEFELHHSEPLVVAVLGGQECRIIVDSYELDAAKEDFHEAIDNFLSIDEAVLKDAEQHIFEYYEDCYRAFGREDPSIPRLRSSDEIWNHIRLGKEAIVSRRVYGDKGIYISVECECDWEPEHGLEIVFRNGSEINKVGQYDGHLTTSDAYADASLENVVYYRL